MNVFIPFSNTYLTAKTLDLLRLNKQIIECDTLIKTIQGDSKAWRNHPCTLMYANHVEWLQWYRNALNDWRKSKLINTHPEPQRPLFIGYEPLHNAHKARLYQKNPIHYEQFKEFANFTDMNWYVVDDKIRKYKNGKLIEVEMMG